MYNIAVVVQNFSVEYADLIINGIYRFFEDKTDFRVYFVQSSNPHSTDGTYDYQYWVSMEYLKSKVIDELIILSNTYCLYKTKDEFRELIRPYFSKKIISIGMDLEVPEVHYTTASCEQVYDEIVSYLKNEHGCTKIAFFSAGKIQSQEGEERFNAFKKALKKHGLKFHKEWVLSGAFTMSSANAELKEKYQSRDQIEYEAIICANDLMGMAVLEYFTALGIKIPSEMKVFGFDNTSHSVLSVPTLATVDQKIEEQGFATAEFGMKLLTERNKKHPQFINLPLQAIYRKSCGSEDLQEQKKRDVLKVVLNHYDAVKRIGILFDVIKGTSSLSDFAESFTNIVGSCGFTTMAVFVLNEPISLMRNDDFYLPGEARMLLNIDTKKGIAEYYEDSDFFDIKESLFPKELLNEGGRFIFQPVFLGTMQYGYLICKAEKTDFGLNSILLKVITSVIVQAYDYTNTIKQKMKLELINRELKERNTDLNIRSKTDELTGLLNRRGFMEYGQKLIFFASDVNTVGVVFFADLDGLKKINDKFGHEYGDKAIKAAAEALKLTFRKMDIIGRLSGDEFGVIASGMEVGFLDRLREKLDLHCEELSEKYELPFKLSISMGAVKFSSEFKDLSELLTMADQDLYVQKKIHHSRKK